MRTARSAFEAGIFGEGGWGLDADEKVYPAETKFAADAAAEVTHLYAYDHLGNVRVKQVTIEGLTASRTIEYVHDLAGRVTRLIYPDGAQARYAYAGAGRLTRVWDEKGKTLAAYTHTAAGNIDRHVVGDEVATGTYTYNAREWVTGISYPGKFTVTQQYDAVGNVTAQNYRRAASESEKAAAYTYDNLYRLTAFNLDGGANTRSYTYDRNGNITALRTNGVTTWYEYYNTSTPNRVTAVYGGGPFIQTTHNLNGWITRFAGNGLTYDYRGLVTGHGSATYAMDPDRRRVKKTVGTVTTYYLRGAGGTVLAEYSGQTLSARYVYAGSRRIARIAGDDSARYYLADHLGSTRSLVDEAGAVTAAYDYWPYGKILALSGTGTTHFRFTGHERDAESGLDYMLERSYGSEIGRFLRPDPMQDEYPGLSPYAYANNNPLKYVDPDGRKIVLGSFKDRFLNFLGYKTKNLRQIETGVNVLKGTPTGNALYQDLHRREDVTFNIESGNIDETRALGRTMPVSPGKIDITIDLDQIKSSLDKYLENRGYGKSLTFVQGIALIIGHELGHGKAADDDIEEYNRQVQAETDENDQAYPYEIPIYEELTSDPDPEE